MNIVILIGRLTRDPEKTYTSNGTAITKFGLALDNGFGDNKRTVFVDITAWSKTAEFVSSYFSKGKEILIEGRLEFDTWEAKEGGKRSKLYVTAEKVSFVGGAKSRESQDQGQEYESKGSVSSKNAQEPSDENSFGQENSEPSALSDDDIPF